MCSMILSTITPLKPVTLCYSNPKRPYWRKNVDMAAGQSFVAEITENNAQVGLCFRLWRTPSTYWYTCQNSASDFKVST